jgi:hypothetical protein
VPQVRPRATEKGFELEITLRTYDYQQNPVTFLSVAGVKLSPAKLDSLPNKTRARMELDKLMLEGAMKVMDDQKPIHIIDDYTSSHQLRMIADAIDAGKVQRTSVRMTTVEGRRILQIEFKDRDNG